MTLPSGLISTICPDHSLLEKWTSSLPGSRASHIQSQETDRESPMSAISGLKRGELLMRYDQSGESCWRTYQASMFDLTMDGQHMGALYSENFPNSGMIVSGQLYRLPTQAHPISANDGGSRHIPTPSASDGFIQNLNSTQQKPDTFKSLNLPDYTTRYPDNGSGLWPTPRARDYKDGLSTTGMLEEGNTRVNSKGVRYGATLGQAAAKWPTPTASEGSKISSRPNYGQVGLSNHPDIVGTPDRPKMAKNRKGIRQNKWSTPTARDHKDGTAESCSNVPENGLLGRTLHEGQNQPNAALNPDWVEWLMGVPIGWSSPEPLPEGAWEEWITDITSGTWWDTERDIPRVTTERTNRNKRLKALGNGIVPRCIPVFLGVVPCIVQETD